MTVPGTGVTTGDFTQILADFGRVVSWKKVTKTMDAMTGTETSTFATAADKTAIYFQEDVKYIWDKEGLLAAADAYMLSVPGVFSRYDQVTIDGITFYVEQVIQRYVLTTGMLEYCRLFRVA